MEPAFSSASFNGRNLHTTLILSSAGGSLCVGSATEELSDILEDDIPDDDILVIAFVLDRLNLKFNYEVLVYSVNI